MSKVILGFLHKSCYFLNYVLLQKKLTVNIPSRNLFRISTTYRSYSFKPTEDPKFVDSWNYFVQ